MPDDDPWGWEWQWSGHGSSPPASAWPATKLLPTTIPVAGGKASFDKRFAEDEDMVCGPFNE
jgi:hypothetical protein